MRNTGIVKLIAEGKIRLGTGIGYVSDLKYIMFIAITLKVYMPDASNLLLGMISLIGVLLLLVLGWFDLRYVKLHQTVAEINTRKYNPFFTKLEASINGKV